MTFTFIVPVRIKLNSNSIFLELHLYFRRAAIKNDNSTLFHDKYIYLYVEIALDANIYILLMCEQVFRY